MLEFEEYIQKRESIESFLTIKSMKVVEEYIQLCVDQGISLLTIADRLKSFNYSFDTRGINWEHLVSAVARRSKIKHGSFENVCIYETEARKICALRDENARQFLYIALVTQKWDNHPSGWIKYERDDFFDFWEMKLSAKEKEKVASMAVNAGMQLRVVGSKKPIPCFHIDFGFSNEECLSTERIYPIFNAGYIKSTYQQIKEDFLNE